MSFFGVDFLAGLKNWQYPSEKQMGFWRGVGLFALLFALLQVLQIAIGLLLFRFVFKDAASGIGSQISSDQARLIAASMIGMFPAAMPIVFLTLYLSRFGLAKMQGQLPLRFPALGFLGWAFLIGGFILSMALLGNVLYAAFGVDPSKELGLVEKTISDLAKDPRLITLILPSVVLGAPLAEEFLFRGVLFSALTPTFVGKWGAVIITSAVWALAHAGPAPWINVGLIFLMGLVLGLLLLRTGSLWVTIACHTAWNALTTITLLGLGGQP
jgi:uncharacterized protein